MSRLFVFLVLLIPFGPGCSLGSWEEPVGSADTNLYVYCEGGFSCAPYEVCVTEGVVWCESRSCWTDGRINLSCVDAINAGGSPPPMPPPMMSDAGMPYMPPPAGSMCGRVDAPWQQTTGAADRAYCHSFPSARNSDDNKAFGWINVTADAPGSTMTIRSATLYALDGAGRVVAITGSGTSMGVRMWAEYGSRTPWFGAPAADLADPTGPLPYTFTVPTDRVLHMGLWGVDVTGYREVFFVMEVSTTGNAQAQVGVDYDNNLTPEPGERRREGGVSNWYTCSSGGSVRFASPRYTMSCEETLASISSAPPPPPPPVSSHDLVVRLSGAMQSRCRGGWEITIWGPGANLVSAPGGEIRRNDPYSWAGDSSLTLRCPAESRWFEEWGMWSGWTTAATGAFDELSMCGADQRSTVTVRNDPFAPSGSSVRPVISWGSVRGSCP